VSSLRFYEIAERTHGIQNPTSREKLVLLGERLGLGPDARVVDFAAGRGGPAIVLAEAFRCRVLCIERSPVFARSASLRVAEAGLDGLVEVREADARAEAVDTDWDVALCLGATFVWDGLVQTLEALGPLVRRGGHVVVGEPFWETWPRPVGMNYDDYVSLPETVDRFRSTGLEVVALIASSPDDWDRYETLHWQAVATWLRENPGAPEAVEIREENARRRASYLIRRGHLGWAILAGLQADG
jgi:predicted O-methyltransferase YrrM